MHIRLAVPPYHQRAASSEQRAAPHPKVDATDSSMFRRRSEENLTSARDKSQRQQQSQEQKQQGEDPPGPPPSSPPESFSSKSSTSRQSLTRRFSARKMVNSLTRPRSAKNDEGGKSHVCLILVSSVCSTNAQEVSQRMCRDALNSKGLLFEEIDGADPQNAHKRDFLFTVSKLKGQYPQVFLANPETGMHKFIGTWEVIEELLDCNDIDKEILATHNEIRTFDREFATVKRGNPQANLPTVW